MDNERSWVNLENQKQSRLQQWAKEEGIELERTPADTPEPNGGAERAGGRIKTMARTMLISARLPEDLWPEAVKTASYLHNKNPSPLHSWKSPDEVIQIWMNAHYRWFDPKRLASAKCWIQHFNLLDFSYFLSPSAPTYT
jgi:hypothetical protein